MRRQLSVCRPILEVGEASAQVLVILLQLARHDAVDTLAGQTKVGNALGVPVPSLGRYGVALHAQPLRGNLVSGRWRAVMVAPRQRKRVLDGVDQIADRRRNQGLHVEIHPRDDALKWGREPNERGAY